MKEKKGMMVCSIHYISGLQQDKSQKYQSMGYTQRIRGPQGPDVQACIFPGATGGKTANRSGNPRISTTTTRYTGGKWSVDDHENACPSRNLWPLDIGQPLVHRSLIHRYALSFPSLPSCFSIICFELLK